MSPEGSALFSSGNALVYSKSKRLRHKAAMRKVSAPLICQPLGNMERRMRKMKYIEYCVLVFKIRDKIVQIRQKRIEKMREALPTGAKGPAKEGWQGKRRDREKQQHNDATNTTTKIIINIMMQNIHTTILYHDCVPGAPTAMAHRVYVIQQAALQRFKVLKREHFYLFPEIQSLLVGRTLTY